MSSRIERERLRHVADAIARAYVAGIDRLARTAKRRRSLAGSRPVSIFIVVVLPQPFGPTNPKISPRSMVKLTWSTAVKSPNRRVRSRATMTGSWSCAGRGGTSRRAAPCAALLRQERDEGLLDCVRSRLRLEVRRGAGCQHAAGVHGDQPIETIRLFHIGGCDEHAHAGTSRHACDRSGPRTDGATADRRRSLAHRGSESRDRG